MAAALVLLAVPVVAQQGEPPRQGPAMGRGMMMGGPEAMGRNPVAVVLDHREELELTAEQVETLDGLKDRLQKENGPRWEQLKAAFGDTAPAQRSAEERQALRHRMQELEPVREEIQAANHAVMAEVHELLSDDQEAKLRGIMQRRRPGPRPMRGRGPGDELVGAAWRSGFREGRGRGCRAGRPLRHPDR